MIDPINAALETGHKKLTELLRERARIDKEIVEWKRVIDSLLAVSEEDSSDPSDVQISSLGAESGKKTIRFTDGVRMVLSQNASRDVPISVPEIRDQLTNLGFDFAKYAQPLVPIHNTLKRLEEQGEVSPLKNAQGQTLGYTWISPIERALNDDLPIGYGEATGHTIPSIYAERFTRFSSASGSLRAAARRKAAATLPIGKRRRERPVAIERAMKKIHNGMKDD
jgi:hypothetical protein